MPFEITIPRLGWSMEEGTFAGWMKKDGDLVRRGEALFELEGEKALQEIEALDDGVLRIPSDGPQPGTVLKVGAVIGYLLADGEALPQSHSASETASTNSDNSLNKTSVPVASESTGSTVSASPSVRRLARELGVSLSDVTPSGANDRVTDDDIRLAATRTTDTPSQSMSPTSTTTSELIATPRARRAARRIRC
jgi:pyruvate dehydrogenase E2 component (dihydrolipoamide acetyltransferase)